MAMTYVDALNAVIPMVDGEVAEKLTALREQMAKKKGSSKPTKTQVENEGIKGEILELLADGRMTCGDVVKALDGEYTSQKISALLRQLVADASMPGAALSTLNAQLALSLARHAAIPYGQILSNEEMENIINELFSCSNVNYTPDGKAILCILPQGDIEHLLG